MKTVYRCELCGQEFTTWEKCRPHEDSHPKVMKTEPYFKGASVLPETIFIHFNDGNSGMYKLEVAYPTEEPTEKESPENEA